MEKQEYRQIIKHLVSEGKSAKQIDDDFARIYGDRKPSYTTVKKWVAHFKTGHTSLQDEPRSGRPKNALSPQMEAKIEALVLNNRKISINSVVEAVGSSYFTVYNYVTKNLGFKKMNARWVPNKLTEAQKTERVRVARSILRQWSSQWAELKTKLITSDETWICYETPHNRLSSREWRIDGEKPPEISRIQSNRKKMMMTVFWDARGPILFDYFVQNSSKGMNAEYYESILTKLMVELAKKRRGIRKRGPLLLIDNAPIHKAPRISEFLNKKGFKKLDHPPYSPDLAPSDFYLFKALKTWLRGQKFTDSKELQESVEAWFDSKSSEWYEQAFDRLKERFKHVIQIRGEYLPE